MYISGAVAVTKKRTNEKSRFNLILINCSTQIEMVVFSELK